MTMTLGAAGTALIKSFEAYRDHAYLPTPHDVWTIGWGHTKGVYQGMTCTPAQAEQFFHDDTAAAVAAVNASIPTTVTQNQFDAMVSLAFNIGIGNFEHSTLVQLLRSGAQRALVGGQFLRWNKQAGTVLAGLTRRREAEQKLFMS